MKLKLIVLALLFISMLPEMNAQEQTDKANYKNRLGLGVGYSAGSGITYRHTFTKFGAQLAAFPYVTDDQTRFNIGITLLYDLVQTGKSKLFLYQGNAYTYNKLKDVSYFESNSTTFYEGTRDELEQRLVNSLGLGYELLFGDRIGLNLMGGYAFSARSYDSNILSVTGEISLLYRY